MDMQDEQDKIKNIKFFLGFILFILSINVNKGFLSVVKSFFQPMSRTSLIAMLRLAYCEGHTCWPSSY